MRNTLRRAATAAAATGAMLALSAGPASAASPIDQWRFHDQGSDAWGCWLVQPEGPEEDWPAPDYVLAHDFDVSGAGSFQMRGSSTGPGFHDRVRGTETWTLGDHVLTHTFSNNVRDATVVVDGAGPGTLLITVSASGHDEFWLDGVRYRDSGHVVFRFSVHHNGTLTDAEDDFGFVFLGIVKPSTGTNEGADLSFDPCSTLGELV